MGSACPSRVIKQQYHWANATTLWASQPSALQRSSALAFPPASFPPKSFLPTFQIGSRSSYSHACVPLPHRCPLPAVMIRFFVPIAVLLSITAAEQTKWTGNATGINYATENCTGRSYRPELKLLSMPPVAPSLILPASNAPIPGEPESRFSILSIDYLGANTTVRVAVVRTKLPASIETLAAKRWRLGSQQVSWPPLPFSVASSTAPFAQLTCDPNGLRRLF